MSTETDSFNFQPRAHISISRVDHSTSIMKSVDDIFQKQLFTDVCLSCENQIINAHRLILAASTSFFHSLFSQQPCCLNPNPVIVMKDIKISELKAILEFIYFGSTTVPEDQLNSLIKSAESLGVYGLGKLNPDSINDAKDDAKDDRPSSEINNNVTNNSAKSSSPSNAAGKEQSPKSASGDASTTKQFSQAASSAYSSNNKSQPDKSAAAADKIKRKVVASKQSEADDLEEKRKKRELINLTISQNASASTSQQSSTSNSPSRADQSKRQSLRIRYRKNNPDPTKDASSDPLNNSQNSELSLSETLATNGKRLKRADFDLDAAAAGAQNDELLELMSVDGSDYCTKSSPNSSQQQQQQQLSQDNGEESTANGNSLLSANKNSMRERTLKLKRNKNSILRKQPNDAQPAKAYKLMLNKSDDSFGLMATRRSQLDELGLQAANQVLTDDDDEEDNNNDLYEENIVMKKLDSPAGGGSGGGGGSLNTSRKNSVDSNNGNELNLIRLRDRGDHNESSTSAGNQSLLAKQSQQKKKRRRTSIDNDS